MQRNTSLRLPGGRGVLWGAFAYLAGFAFTVVVVAAGRSQFTSSVTIPREGTSPIPLPELLTGVHIPVWKWGGLAFYNAHLTDVAFRGLPDQFRTGATGVNLLAEAGGPYLALFAVPPILLVVSGVLVTRDATTVTELRYDFSTGGGRFALNGGLLVLLGYLPLTFAGAIVLSADLAGNAGVQADLLKSWVVVGMIYPFLFGGLGGYLRYWLA